MDRGLVGQSELRAAALLKAIWWYLHLASMLTHLLLHSTIYNTSDNFN